METCDEVRQSVCHAQSRQCAEDRSIHYRGSYLTLSQHVFCVQRRRFRRQTRSAQEIVKGLEKTLISLGLVEGFGSGLSLACSVPFVVIFRPTSSGLGSHYFSDHAALSSEPIQSVSSFVRVSYPPPPK